MYNKVQSRLHILVCLNSHHSTSELDNDETSDWTFGESIIRTLSRRDITLFNLDNPQTER